MTMILNDFAKKTEFSSDTDDLSLTVENTTRRRRNGKEQQGNIKGSLLSVALVLFIVCLALLDISI